MKLKVNDLGLLPISLVFLTSFFFEHIQVLVGIKYYIMLLLLIVNVAILICRKKKPQEKLRTQSSLMWITVLVWFSTIYGIHGFTIAHFADAVLLTAFYTVMIVARGRCNINDCMFALKLVEKVCAFYALSLIVSPIIPTAIKSAYSSIMVPTSAVIYMSRNPGICISATISALYIMMGIGLVFARIVISKTVKIGKYFELLVFIIALFNSGRRAHFAFSLVACIIIYLLSSSPKKIPRRILILTLFISLSYAFVNEYAYLFSPESSIGRLIATISDLNTGKDYSSSRTTLGAIALALFKNNPVFGIGWNGFINTYIGIPTLENSLVHNNYLQILCECGVVGLCIYTIWYIKTTRNYLSLLKREKESTVPDGGLFIVLITLYYLIFNALYGITASCICFINMQAMLAILLISGNTVSFRQNRTINEVNV